MQLCDKYPFLTKYFENGINNPNRAIAHSILFYGNDIPAQYEIALYIARLLNCKKSKTFDCNCLDCNWIREGTHPAVLTISKNDNKPSDDDSKTVISVKQSLMIKNSLTTTSDAHRVFIFCDKDDNDEPAGLNALNFQEETANSLLKVIEEPPSNTTFFFLTRDKNDLISTIISRSQCFFVPATERENYDFDDIKETFEDYLSFNRRDVFELAKKLHDISKNNIKTLEQMQNYMLYLLKSNPHLKIKLINDLTAVETAKKQISARITPLNVFENLCLNLIK